MSAPAGALLGGKPRKRGVTTRWSLASSSTCAAKVPLLGSLQIASARAHAGALSEHLVAADPQVAARLRSGAAQLNQALSREAGVLAYNDVFLFVAALALATAACVAFTPIANAVRQRLLTPKELQP